MQLMRQIHDKVLVLFSPSFLNSYCYNYKNSVTITQIHSINPEEYRNKVFATKITQKYTDNEKNYGKHNGNQLSQRISGLKEDFHLGN